MVGTGAAINRVQAMRKHRNFRAGASARVRGEVLLAPWCAAVGAR